MSHARDYSRERCLLSSAGFGRSQRVDQPDIIFEHNILLGSDDNRALELAENIRKQLVDTYKLLHPLIEVRERDAFRDQSFFAENDVSRDGDGDVELDEDSE
jgi:hypothetical protein